MGVRGEPGYRGDFGDDVVGPTGQKGDQGETGEPGRRPPIIYDNELRQNITIIAKGFKGEKGYRGQRGEKGIKGILGSVGLPVRDIFFFSHISSTSLIKLKIPKKTCRVLQVSMEYKD